LGFSETHALDHYDCHSTDAAKLFVFPLKNSGAISSQQADFDVHQMHKDTGIQKMPAQGVNDMSLLFDRNN
jgi:hypothetical protein